MHTGQIPGHRLFIKFPPRQAWGAPDVYIAEPGLHVGTYLCGERRAGSRLPQVQDTTRPRPHISLNRFCNAQSPWASCSDSLLHALPHTAGKLQHSSAAWSRLRRGRLPYRGFIPASLADRQLGRTRTVHSRPHFIMISFATPVSCTSRPTPSHVPDR